MKNPTPAMLAQAVKETYGGTLLFPNLPSREAWERELERYSPGCGAMTHVAGTSGGTMPCGAMLSWPGHPPVQTFCAYCQDQIDASKAELRGSPLSNGWHTAEEVQDWPRNTPVAIRKTTPGGEFLYEVTKEFRADWALDEALHRERTKSGFKVHYKKLEP